MSYLRLWRYRVHADRLAEFIAAYGARGDWARLFGRSAGYRGTELLHDAQDPLRFVTIDRWASEADWQAFLAAHRADYRALDARLAPWCAKDVEIGNFTAPG
jgi:heme-degrading monooxygenase HmoA